MPLREFPFDIIWKRKQNIHRVVNHFCQVAGMKEAIYKIFHQKKIEYSLVDLTFKFMR